MNSNDEFNNQNIVINAPNEMNSVSSQQARGGKIQNAFKSIANFVGNKLGNKDDTLPSNEQGNKTSINNVDISTSAETTQENMESNTCQDKIKEKLISSIEVEKNIKVFMSLLCIGSLILCMGFCMLPLIVTSPSKFSFCFAIGSLLILLSFLFFHGTKTFFNKLFEKKRFYLTSLFVLSIFFGIIFSLGKHYFLSLICSLCQLIGLYMFVLSFIPGGQCGIDCVKNLLKSPLSWMMLKSNIQIDN